MKKPWILFLAVFAVVGAIYYFSAAGRKEIKLKHAIGVPPVTAAKALQTPKEKFYPIDPSLPEELKARIPSGGMLNEEQRAGLVTKLNEFFQCYSDGSYERYVTFRSGDRPVRFALDQPALRKEFERAQAKGIAFGEDPATKAQQIWAHLTGSTTNGGAPRLTALQLEYMRVAITNAPAADSDADLDTFVKGASQAQVVAKYPSLFAVDERVPKRGQPLRALVGVPCKTSRAEHPMFVTLSLIWSPEDKEWVPVRMASDARVRATFFL